MISSQLTSLEREILSCEKLSQYAMTYFQERLRNRLHDLVLKEYLAQSKKRGIKKSHIAARLGKSPAQITRWLGSPGNWTLSTVSDLLLAMGCEPELAIARIVKSNGDSRPASSQNTSSTVVSDIQTSWSGNVVPMSPKPATTFVEMPRNVARG